MWRQVAKVEHQMTQQQRSLQDVRLKHEVVNDEVCAWRALVADLAVPTSPTSLPAPRTRSSSFRFTGYCSRELKIKNGTWR